MQNNIYKIKIKKTKIKSKNKNKKDNEWIVNKRKIKKLLN